MAGRRARGGGLGDTVTSHSSARRQGALATLSFRHPLFFLLRLLPFLPMKSHLQP